MDAVLHVGHTGVGGRISSLTQRVPHPLMLPLTWLELGEFPFQLSLASSGHLQPPTSISHPENSDTNIPQPCSGCSHSKGKVFPHHSSSPQISDFSRCLCCKNTCLEVSEKKQSCAWDLKFAVVKAEDSQNPAWVFPALLMLPSY